MTCAGTLEHAPWRNLQGIPASTFLLLSAGQVSAIWQRRGGAHGGQLPPLTVYPKQ